jgi:GT2 family glycosyltransferase
VGAVSGKLLFMTRAGDKTDQIYTTGHLLTRSRAPVNRGYKQKDVGQLENLEMIFAANGAAPLYRREMLEDVSINDDFFCEDFFMYGEDHDLGWRAQLQGWKCAYAPKAIGYHVGFGSGAIRNFYIRSQFTRNRYLTLIRNDQLLDFVIDLPYILAYELIWQAYTLFHSPKRLPAHWIGILQAIGAIGKTYTARKEIQQRRRVERGYIRSFFVSKLW